MFYFNIYKDFIDIRLQVITVASPTNILQYTRGHSWVRFAICRSFLFAALVGKLKATRSDAYPRPRPPGTPTDRPHPVPGVPRAVTAVAASPLPPPSSRPRAPGNRSAGPDLRSCVRRAVRVGTDPSRAPRAHRASSPASSASAGRRPNAAHPSQLTSRQARRAVGRRARLARRSGAAGRARPCCDAGLYLNTPRPRTKPRRVLVPAPARI